MGPKAHNHGRPLLCRNTVTYRTLFEAVHRWGYPRLSWPPPLLRFIRRHGTERSLL